MSIKEIKSRYKSKEIILLEGINSISSAINANLEIETIYINKKKQNIQKEINSTNIEFVDNNFLKRIGSTKTPYPAIGIAKYPNTISKFNPKNKINYPAIFLYNIQDPGNLGTIIRSSLAFDFKTIILSQSSVSPFNPKVIRSSVGYCFNISNFYIIDDTMINPFLSNDYDFELITLDIKGENISSNYKFQKNSIILFGNEGYGLPDDLYKLCKTKIKIPISKSVESLNLATTVSIIQYNYYNQFN